MKKLAYLAIGVAGVIALLIFGESVLIPFVYGTVLWFLCRHFKNLLGQIPLLKGHIPNWLANTLVLGIALIGFGIMSELITSNIGAILDNSQLYKANFDMLVDAINTIFHFNLFEQLSSTIKQFDYTALLSSMADSLSGALGDFIMIILYAIFIFSEEPSLRNKMKKVLPDTSKYERTYSILTKIDSAVSDYIRLKTYVSLLTGFVGYIFLSIMGLEAAFFWAFLMFALNYIPTIGSLTATLFPAMFSLVQFGEFTPFIIILVGLGTIEWLIGNLLEPKIMGSSLNLSPLVTILALVIWGSIWGITGMLLSVPITVVMVIIFSQFSATRSIAILLSKKGNIDEIHKSEP